ncbi:MAG: hypothetical protein E6R03_12200 [Hyphomicrobiaceae bacterium]|nr:MAG: hypothetical protein E6R03_12200 [Hyphomicrobiaceae bacterium]
MTSALQIRKAAIARLGGEVPQSISEDVDELIAANAIYDSVVGYFLTKHAWSFAVKEVEIAVTDAEPFPPWNSEYAKPADCRNVRDVRDQYGCKVAYDLRGTKIYTRRYPASDPTLTLTYNGTPDESLWPDDFAAAVEEELLGRLLGAFEERIRSLEVRQIAKGMLAEAVQRDRRQNPPFKPNRSPLLRAWRNGAVDRT